MITNNISATLVFLRNGIQVKRQSRQLKGMRKLLFRLIQIISFALTWALIIYLIC